MQPTQGGTRPRNVRTQDEELLLAECFIQISEDPKRGAGQSKETFWYRVLNVYNMEAEKHKWTIRTKNMLTGKWTPMNKEVTKWNSLVNETSVMSGESDKDFMAMVHTLYKTVKIVHFMYFLFLMTFSYIFYFYVYVLGFYFYVKNLINVMCIFLLFKLISCMFYFM